MFMLSPFLPPDSKLVFTLSPSLPPRSAVFIMPTVNCLVELTEMPFCVVSIGDIEIVNLERVGFNLKNFDMAIVFKDFTRDVSRGEGGVGGGLRTICASQEDAH